MTRHLYIAGCIKLVQQQYSITYVSDTNQGDQLIMLKSMVDCLVTG